MEGEQETPRRKTRYAQKKKKKSHHPQQMTAAKENASLIRTHAKTAMPARKLL